MKCKHAILAVVHFALTLPHVGVIEIYGQADWKMV